MKKIKRGDTVLIRAGKDSGKKGKVIAVIPNEARLVVEGRNLVKKHVRPRRQGEKGQVVEVPAAVPVSRVMVVCPSCNKGTRVGIKRSEKDGKGSAVERVCKKCSKVIT